MQNTIIKLENVSKKYSLFHEKPTLVENLFRGRLNEEFWALKNINLSIINGERVGIIGPNGSGKTTLMEVIAGITTPSSGKVEVRGDVASLIELDAGFHPEINGRQNIILNGMLIGMSKQEVYSKLSNIIKFAKIGKFIDSPFYTYSQGMKLRLGFSIVSQTDASIFLLDENISVGDELFRKKSVKKIVEFARDGKTLIFVSHDLGFVKYMCTKIIWVDKGKIKKIGGLSLLEEYSQRRISKNKYE